MIKVSLGRGQLITWGRRWCEENVSRENIKKRHWLSRRSSNSLFFVNDLDAKQCKQIFIKDYSLVKIPFTNIHDFYKMMIWCSNTLDNTDNQLTREEIMIYNENQLWSVEFDHYSGNRFWFKEIKDAIQFKLVWG